MIFKPKSYSNHKIVYFNYLLFHIFACHNKFNLSLQSMI